MIKLELSDKAAYQLERACREQAQTLYQGYQDYDALATQIYEARQKQS